MSGNEKSRAKLESGCRLDKVCGPAAGQRSAGDLFSRDWEVFVVKRDRSTGRLVGKIACCALAPV